MAQRRLVVMDAWATAARATPFLLPPSVCGSSPIHIIYMHAHSLFHKPLSSPLLSSFILVLPLGALLFYSSASTNVHGRIKAPTHVHVAKPAYICAFRRHSTLDADSLLTGAIPSLTFDRSEPFTHFCPEQALHPLLSGASPLLTLEQLVHFGPEESGLGAELRPVRISGAVSGVGAEWRQPGA
eukprot:scaffold14632_cov119-Isochrysis_galbana.AAC.2